MQRSAETVFTQDELDAMCRSRDERMRDALESGDKEAAVETLRALVGAVREFCFLYRDWTALTHEYLYTQHGRAAGAASVRPERVAEIATRSGMSLDDLMAAQAFVESRDTPAVLKVLDAIERGDAEDTMAAWAESERLVRLTLDFRRDVMSDVLGYVYREFGADELVAAHKFAYERGFWATGLADRAATEPAQQLEATVSMLIVAAFSDASVVERDDRWTVTTPTCPCGRQLRDRYSDNSWGLEIVRDDGPLTFKQGALTPYQTHLPVMHHICPIEQLGAPSPPFTCNGLNAGEQPCELHVFKRMSDTTAEFYESVDMVKP